MRRKKILFRIVHLFLILALVLLPGCQSHQQKIENLRVRIQAVEEEINIHIQAEADISQLEFKLNMLQDELDDLQREDKNEKQ